MSEADERSQLEAASLEAEAREASNRRLNLLIVGVAVTLGLLFVIIYLWRVNSQRQVVTDQTPTKEAEKAAREKAEKEKIIKDNEEATKDAILMAKRRQLLAQVLFGNNNAKQFEGLQDGASYLNTYHSTNTYTSLSAADIFSDANPPPGDGSKPAPSVSDPPISQQDSVSRQIIAAKLCPSGKDDKYDLDGNAQDGLYSCNYKCEKGFETIWYAPRDNDGLPLKEEIPKLDINGQPMLDPETKKPLKELVTIAPTSWCRANCPIQLESKHKWSRTLASSDYMSRDAIPVTLGGVIQRTDAGDDNAYCSRSTVKRQLLRGGANIACGWCDQDLTQNKGFQTNNNVYICDDKDDHAMGINYTDWCQRRRLIPNWRTENLDGSKSTGILDTPLCAAIEGALGKPKHMNYLQGPKACKIGDLLPINPAGYFDRNSTGILHTGNLFYGSSDLAADTVVGRISGKAVSIFLLACYSSCPQFMIPLGNVEDHLCGESCPPNTTPVTSMGQFDFCKKTAYIKRPYIPDFLKMVDDIAVALLTKYRNDPKKTT